MKISSVSEVKKELNNFSKEELFELLQKLIKFNKENKELTHYLLFEDEYEEGYIQKIKEEITIEFARIDKRSWKTMKKTIQRILKLIKKYIKYSKKPETEIQLLLFFCEKLREYKISFTRNPIVLNIYIRQINAINKALLKLHEDIQFDYKEEIELASSVL
jgi:hypothetical protein